MTEVTILEAPIGSETEIEVRAALAAEYPEYEIGKLAKNETGGVWEVRLERLAEFPLKGLGPEGETDNEVDAPEPGGEGEGKPKPKLDKLDEGGDDPEADDDEGGNPFAEKGEKKPGELGDHLHGGGESEGDPIARMEHLLHDLKKVVPQLQALLRGDGVPGGDAPMGPPPHLEHGGEHPPMGGAGGPSRPSVPPHAPGVGGPPGMGGPPGGPGMGGPPGGGRPRPGGAPSRGQLPTFTHRKTMRLEREVGTLSPKEARAEVLEEFPGYKIDEFTREGEKYVAKLVRQ